MNYYNYFTEIEEAFVSRRGSHFLISPLDWSLIESWRERGIPLEVALRGIHAAFDGYDSQPRRSRKVNSLFYCRQEVEAAFERHLESRVGKPDSGDPTTTAQQESEHIASLAAYLDERRSELDALARSSENHPQLAESFDRAATRLDGIIAVIRQTGEAMLERLEEELMEIETWLLESMRRSVTPDELSGLRREAESQLKGYKQGMEAAVYETTVEKFVARRLRERFRVPRMSLFYM
jgi:Xaa-Pro aminopeptidase